MSHDLPHFPTLYFSNRLNLHPCPTFPIPNSPDLPLLLNCTTVYVPLANHCSVILCSQHGWPFLIIFHLPHPPQLQSSQLAHRAHIHQFRLRHTPIWFSIVELVGLTPHQPLHHPGLGTRGNLAAPGCCYKCELAAAFQKISAARRGWLIKTETLQ